MSKCWYCNEELTTANYCDEHIGICTKCYNSMFKVSNDFVKGLTDKIADLEAKLAEKDNEIEKLKLLIDGIDKYKQYNKDAKQLIILNPDNIYADGNHLIIKSHNQDKISFCIEQLEQLKKLCQEKFNWWENSEWEGNIYDKSDVSNAYFDIEANIDNQIEELKKGL